MSEQRWTGEIWARDETYLGQSKESLGHVHYVAHLFDVVDALFDGLRVRFSGLGQDAFNALSRSVSEGSRDASNR